MSTTTSKITVIEDFRDKDGHGGVWTTTPDFAQPMYPGMAEFIFKASQALRTFRDEWIESHSEDNWARDLELDTVPILTQGMIAGYMVISEIDGKSYDYVPAKPVREEEETTK